MRELELLPEAGLHNYEVLKAETSNRAQTLREPKLGRVRPGYTADLLIVDRSPAYNLAFLYGFGANTLKKGGKMVRLQGIVQAIKDGIVIEKARMLDVVARMVAESKKGVPAGDSVRAPFVPPASP